MTDVEAEPLPPLHMRRNDFDPTPELREIRESTGVRIAKSAFGMDVYLVTRHEDAKAVLSDHQRFSNGRPPGFVIPGAGALGGRTAAQPVGEPTSTSTSTRWKRPAPQRISSRASRCRSRRW